MNYAADIGYPAAKPKIKKLPQRGQRRAQAWTSEALARLFAQARKESPELVRLLAFPVHTVDDARLGAGASMTAPAGPPSGAGARKLLHVLADVLADLLEQSETDRDGRRQPGSPSRRARAKRTKAPALPHPIQHAVEVSELNRTRAREALRRRGIMLPRRDGDG
jgi:hypothetical protein